MVTVVKGDINSFVSDLLRYYREVWEIPDSSFLHDPDIIVEDSRANRYLKVSFVDLDDGEPVGVVYGITAVEST